MRRIALAASLLLLSSACAQLPRVELQAYRDSFQAVQTAATPMIADYAVAERTERLADLQAQTIPNPDDPDGDPIPRYSEENPYFETFDVDDSAALTTIGLPPGAAAVDRAFRGIAAYNDTLVALAENRNIDEARGQLRQIITDVGSILPGQQAAIPVATVFSGVVLDILKPAIEMDNREQFKNKVLEGYPPMMNLIDLLRDHSEDQYATTISPLLTRLETLEANSDSREDLVNKINAWQRVYANYVVLLGAMKERLTELRDAILHPREASVLARASAGAADLRAYAEGLRRSIDELRAIP